MPQQDLERRRQKVKAARRREMLRRRRRRRRMLGILVFILIVAIVLVFRSCGSSDDPIQKQELDVMDLDVEFLEKDDLGYNGPEVATLTFTGDVAVSEDMVADALQGDGTYDFITPFAYISNYLVNSAYAVGSLETTFVDDLGYGGAPFYNAPEQLAGGMKRVGFNMVSTANTYALNNGIDGLISTKRTLNEAQLRSIGTYVSQKERDKNGGAYIREIHGIKFAFLAYTKGTDGVTMPEGCEYALNTLYTDYSDYWTQLRSNKIRSDVQAAKEAGAEVVVALVHWGSEYGRSVSAPQKEAAEMMVANGVDLIVGTHSHLVNEMEMIEVELADDSTRQGLVVYGLGDLYTDPEKDSALESAILQVQFSRENGGGVAISAVSYVPTYMYITETEEGRHFQILDVYQAMAAVGRTNMNSERAALINALLDTIDTVHTYLGEEYDVGPTEQDMRLVQKTIEKGPYSIEAIRRMREEEKAEEAAVAKAQENEEHDAIAKQAAEWQAAKEAAEKDQQD